MKKRMKMKGKLYGEINFLSCKGEVGETIQYSNKEQFEKEIHASNEIGRPITINIIKTYRELDPIHKAIFEELKNNKELEHEL